MLEKLNQLIGITFEYRGKNIVISKVKYVGTSFVIFTNRQTMNFFENEVDIFISELKPFEEKIKIAPIQVKKDELNPNKMEENQKNIVPMQENKPKEEPKGLAVTSNIKLTLLETMEKVKVDKSYIQQANAICNITSQMINILKVELQILNTKK